MSTFAMTAGSAATGLRDVGFVLLMVAFLLPGHYPPWATFESQLAAGFGVGLVALGAAVAGTGLRVGSNGGERGPALAWLAAATALVPLVQRATGRILFTSDAVLPALFLAGFALAIVAGARWRQPGPGTMLDRLFTALGVAAVISVGIALLQWLSIDAAGVWVIAPRPGGPPFGNLGQPNHLASLLALGLVTVWRSHAQGRLRGVVASLAAAWLGFGIVMTQSRTGWLQVGGLLAVMFVLGRLRGCTAARVRPAGVAWCAAAFIGLVLAWPTLNEALRLSAPTTLADRLQPGPRGAIWHAMAGAMLRAPWFGWGWNQIVVAQQAVALDLPPIHRPIDSGHNIALDLALHGGVPLALAWILAVGWWLRGQLRCLGKDPFDIDRLAGLAAVGVLLLHALLEYPLDHLYFLLPLGLLLGALGPAAPVVCAPGTTATRPAGASMAPTADPGRTTASPSRRSLPVDLPLLAGTVAALGLAALVAVEYLRVEQAQREIRMALQGLGAVASASAQPTSAVADVRLLDAPREFQRLMVTTARPGMSAEELAWMHRVALRHAVPPAMLRDALAAGLNGDPAAASLRLRQLCAVHLPARCDEARAAWTQAQQRWPVLLAVPPPG